MNGAEGIADVTRIVRAPCTPPNSLSTPDPPRAGPAAVEPGGDGALAAADKALTRILAGSGFVDITAPFAESFTTNLRYRPVEAELDDLKPGALAELMALVRSQGVADPDRTLQAQAQVAPQAAAKLLA
jgi:hypothetical protein